MNESWLHDRTEEMGGGTLRPPRDKKTSLSLDVKSFSARAKWRCSWRPRRSVDKKLDTTTHVI